MCAHKNWVLDLWLSICSKPGGNEKQKELFKMFVDKVFQPNDPGGNKAGLCWAQVSTRGPDNIFGK